MKEVSNKVLKLLVLIWALLVGWFVVIPLTVVFSLAISLTKLQSPIYVFNYVVTELGIDSLWGFENIINEFLKVFK